MSTEVTRKDRLAANILRIKQNFSKDKDYLDIIPETYVLPE